MRLREVKDCSSRMRGHRTFGMKSNCQLLILQPSVNRMTALR